MEEQNRIEEMKLRLSFDGTPKIKAPIPKDGGRSISNSTWDFSTIFGEAPHGCAVPMVLHIITLGSWRKRRGTLMYVFVFS